jgi:hypothetical protein
MSTAERERERGETRFDHRGWRDSSFILLESENRRGGEGVPSFRDIRTGCSFAAKKEKKRRG